MCKQKLISNKFDFKQTTRVLHTVYSFFKWYFLAKFKFEISIKNIFLDMLMSQNTYTPNSQQFEVISVQVVSNATFFSLKLPNYGLTF
jgi:hypothetical protein